MMACSPRIIPVLDVMGGQVVHAIGGRREQYRPIQSRLTDSTNPSFVSRALIAATGAEELYVADLDAIACGTISPSVADLLAETMTPIWIDAGFGPRLDVCAVQPTRGISPVVGFETCRTPKSFRPRERDIAFSIDLRGGELVGDWQAWRLANERDALGLARQVVALGGNRLIVLDISRVGTGTGCGTDELLEAIRTEFPDIELITGGGVKTWDDIDRLGKAGADAVLVASALHDGTLTFPRPASSAPRP